MTHSFSVSSSSSLPWTIFCIEFALILHSYASLPLSNVFLFSLFCKKPTLVSGSHTFPKFNQPPPFYLSFCFRFQCFTIACFYLCSFLTLFKETAILYCMKTLNMHLSRLLLNSCSVVLRSCD